MKINVWIIAVLMLGLGMPVVQAKPGLDFTQLERLPIQEGGRKKPFSTFAREALQGMTGRTTIVPETRDADGTAWTAVEFATALLLTPEGWDREPLILINFKPLKEDLGMDPARKTFSYQEVATNTKLRDHVRAVQQLREGDPNAPLDTLQREVVQVASRVADFEDMATGRAFAIVPHPDLPNGKWVAPKDVGSLYSEAQAEAVEGAFKTFQSAYVTGDPEAFITAKEELESVIRSLAPDNVPSQRIIELERFYYQTHPFRWAWILCALAAIILGVTSVWGRRVGYRISWGLAAVGFLLMTVGFVMRVVISGRPPVTNMYESVIWVAFGTVFFALIFEMIYKSRVFLVGAMPIAVIALILADTQPTILDRAINPLVPVLRDNFWLTTHVLTITLSYAAFALALGVSHIVLGRVILGWKPVAAMHNYVYKTLQIGVLLLAVGTILGAVWANYSWGRFWDWDPKETWALIALLSYLFVLHGRIAGFWGGFGLAVGSVVGFLSVVMAWYGVNFVLGAGLHSYGFGTGGFPFVAGLTAVELIFVTIAILRRPAAKKKNGKPPKGTDSSDTKQEVALQV